MRWRGPLQVTPECEGKALAQARRVSVTCAVAQPRVEHRDRRGRRGRRASARPLPPTDAGSCRSTGQIDAAERERGADERAVLDLPHLGGRIPGCACPRARPGRADGRADLPAVRVALAGRQPAFVGQPDRRPAVRGDRLGVRGDPGQGDPGGGVDVDGEQPQRGGRRPPSPGTARAGSRRERSRAAAPASPAAEPARISSSSRPAAAEPHAPV